MRLAILADVHGNLPALEAVLADLDRQPVDGLVVAGDVIDGPQPCETLRLLRERGAWLIQGNREKYMLAYDAGTAPPSWHTAPQWASLRWIYRQLDRETMAFVAGLPEQRTVALPGTAPIRVVHGAPQGTSALLLPDRDPPALELFRQAGLLGFGYLEVGLDAALAQVSEPVLVCGHSHLAWRQACDGRLALNPGAVGGSLNGDPRAQYALLAWHAGRWQVEHRAVAYDPARLRAAYRDGGFLDEGGAFAWGTLLATESGRNVLGQFVREVTRRAAEAGLYDYNALPETVWQQVIDDYGWEEAARAWLDGKEKVR